MSSIEMLIAQSLGLESVDLDININEADAAEELAQSQVEVMESVAELETTTDNMETVSDDVESLESLIAVLKGTIDKHEGLDAVSAEMYHIAVDGIVGKYGFGANQILPSMESFGNSPYQNTVVSMENSEGLVQKLKNMLRRLKDGIMAKAREWKDKVVKMFTNAKQWCQMKYNNLKSKLKSLKDKVVINFRVLKDKNLRGVRSQLNADAKNISAAIQKKTKEAITAYAKATTDEERSEILKRFDEEVTQVGQTYFADSGTDGETQVTAEEVVEALAEEAKGTGAKVAEELNKDEQDTAKVIESEANGADAEKLKFLSKLQNSATVKYNQTKAWFSKKSSQLTTLLRKSSDAVESGAESTE